MYGDELSLHFHGMQIFSFNLQFRGMTGLDNETGAYYNNSVDGEHVPDEWSTLHLSALR